MAVLATSGHVAQEDPYKAARDDIRMWAEAFNLIDGKPEQDP